MQVCSRTAVRSVGVILPTLAIAVSLAVALAACATTERQIQTVPREGNRYAVYIPEEYLPLERLDRLPAATFWAESALSEEVTESLNRHRFPEHIAVTVVVLVNQCGEVEDAMVESSDFSVFEADVIRVVKRWRFERASARGAPAKFWFRNEFQFSFPRTADR